MIICRGFPWTTHPQSGKLVPRLFLGVVIPDIHAVGCPLVVKGLELQQSESGDMSYEQPQIVGPLRC